MKIYQCLWRSGKKEIQGAFRAADETSLRRHIESLNGELLRVISEKELPQTEAVVVEKTVTAKKIFVPKKPGLPGGPRKTNLLDKTHASSEADWMIKLWGWLCILGSLGSLLLLLLTLPGIFSTPVAEEEMWDWVRAMGLQQLAIKWAFITGALSLGILGIFSGVGIIAYPVRAAWALLFISILGLIGSLILIISNHFIAGVFGAFFFLYIYWQLTHKE